MLSGNPDLMDFKCKYQHFPDGFMFCTSSAAYQVEGAWNDEGKAESIWDRVAHTRQELFDGDPDSGDTGDEQNPPRTRLLFMCKGLPVYRFSNHKPCATPITGDVACNSYYNIAEDVGRLKELGVQTYRFSLSWPRLLPRGEDSLINPSGVQYYNQLIDALLENNITPLVTIYHWDLPQSIQDLGGWCNRIVVQLFSRYCRFVFSAFGDRVKYWITINEPFNVAESYGSAFGAPALTSSGFGDYLAVHHIILAHATAYRLYDREFRAFQNGQIGICLNLDWYRPKDPNSAQDHYAVHRARMWQFGIFAHPLYFGDYPEDVKRSVSLVSQANGITTNRLSEFDEYEKCLIKGTLDFLGFNHYFSVHATTLKCTDSNYCSLKSIDSNFDLSFMEEYPKWNPMWLKDTPRGLREALCWIRDTYGNPRLFITENGVAGKGLDEDEDAFFKIRYHYGYLTSVLNAINEDGCNVIGYGVWSFMDSFEWFFGYKPKFGIYRVDFEDKKRSRYGKKSTQFFKQLFQTKTLPDVLDQLYG
ncbi:myrosinase 1-like isoform X2 [Adelges cooleyi]|uniref:myrosinase 1-like isoform X2 n=1 Tax=Adelges cooleyi TaxID=133065 RepID=UPI00217F61BE|nr:myrosinase 1-like isoform X2 [Adelges cooleyi]